MNLTLKVWRQKGAQDKGRIVEYKMSAISPDMSFLEMMDVLKHMEHKKNIIELFFWGPLGNIWRASFEEVIDV